LSLTVFVTVWLLLRGSLPLLEGHRSLEGLEGPASIERDALGVPTIGATSRSDAARVTGFVHAQDRFFQMDLMRRSAAGELAALVGKAAIGHDRERRIHRLRTTAREVIARASPGSRSILESYSGGVNAALAAMTVRPFEYLLLRAAPQPWSPEDTVLVVFAMYFQLHDEHARRESLLGRMREGLPPAMFEFLTQDGTSLDAPLVGDSRSSKPVPGIHVCDLRRAERGRLAELRWHPRERSPDDLVAGSNAWAVGPARTRAGAALLANDMHLGLRLPNIWYRLRIRVEGGEPLDVSGASLAGTPAVVAGSNGHVAWGLTNSEGDWVDLVILELDPADPGRYRTSDGYRSFEEHREIIRVRGDADVALTVRSSIWGPVLDVDARGRPRALNWLAHYPEATNLELLQLERARSVYEALEAAPRTGIPPQNLMLADDKGNIAWTIVGRIPRRRGYDPRVPASWADPGRGWLGWLAGSEYPVVVNPPRGAVWTANARVVDGEDLEKIGHGAYALGTRAGQIRDWLLNDDGLGIDDMLTIQLDDRALLLHRWQRLLLALLEPDNLAGKPTRAVIRRHVEAWRGRASVDAVGYRLVREFRRHVRERVFDALVLGCGEMGGSVRYEGMPQSEGALWRIIEERPAHLLEPRFESWDALLLAAADEALGGCGDLEPDACTWGEANTVHIRHPLSVALPILSPWLDMKPEQLPGDMYMPRVQHGIHGASERFAVSPGDEQAGYFHMPGGQSGHPLSPYYRAGHGDWSRGEPTPFLPGPPEYRLRLDPQRS
jgi:penicillin amidase